MRLFVSYARVDKPYCIEIVNTLNAHDVWYDERLYAGQHWWKEILRRLDWCEGLVYLLSPDSVASEYCRKEYDLARSLGRHIFPVVIRENTPVPGSLDEVQYIDLSKGITAEAVKNLLNALYISEREQKSNVSVESIPSEDIKQPVSQTNNLVSMAASSMANGLFDQAVFLIRQAINNGYTSRFINVETFLKEAEAALERQMYLLEAEREYRQIVDLLAHWPTQALAWEAFQAFQKAYPDYDPESLAIRYPHKPDSNVSQSTNGHGSSAPIVFTLPLLEWCHIPLGKVEVVGVDKQGQSRKRQIEVPAFQISKYPVTNAQFQAFLADPFGYRNPEWWQFLAEAKAWHVKNPIPKPPKFKGDERPRGMINWYEANAFCHWLSARLGIFVMLPNSLQWQRACQGEDGRSYPWGNEFDKERCNAAESDLKMTTSVTRYPNGVSPYGVFDMAGNVWEWCSDTRNTDPQITNPKRIMRGGSYLSPGDRAKIPFNFEVDPESCHDSIGFRIVRKT